MNSQPEIPHIDGSSNSVRTTRNTLREHDCSPLLKPLALLLKSARSELFPDLQSNLKRVAEQSLIDAQKNFTNPKNPQNQQSRFRVETKIELSADNKRRHELASKLLDQLDKLTPQLSSPSEDTVMLGLRDHSVIHKAVEVIITWSLHPCFLLGVGVPLKGRVKNFIGDFKFWDPSSEFKWSETQCDHWLFKCTGILTDFLFSPILQKAPFHSKVISSVLMDITTAVLQLLRNRENNSQTTTPSSSSTGIITPATGQETPCTLTKPEQERIISWLIKYQEVSSPSERFVAYTLILSGDSNSQPSSSSSGVISEIAPKVPQWLKSACSRSLNIFVMKNSYGVRLMMKNILSTSDCTEEIPLSQLNSCARVISTPPKNVQKSRWFHSILMQLRDIIGTPFPKTTSGSQIETDRDEKEIGIGSSNQNDQTDSNVLRAAIKAALFCYGKQPKLTAKYLIKPCIQPFIYFAECFNSQIADKIDCSNTESNSSSLDADVVYSEAEIRLSVDCLMRLICSGDVLSHRKMKYNICDAFDEVLPVFFQLWFFSSKTKSNLLRDIHSILLRIFNKRKERIDLLKSALNFFPETIYCNFGLGGSGGASLRHSTTHPFERDIAAEHSSILSFVQELDQENLCNNLFIDLLDFLYRWDNALGSQNSAEYSQLVKFLQLICERLGPSVLRDMSSVVKFLMILIRQNDSSSLQICLAIIGTLISGDVHISAQDESHLSKLLPILEKLKENTDSDIADAAFALQLSLTSRDPKLVEKKYKISSSRKSQAASVSRFDEVDEKQTFRQAMSGLQSPIPAMRTQSVATIRELILSGDKEAVMHLEGVFSAIGRQLHDPESYVYQAVVKSMAAFVDKYPERIVPILTKKFASQTLAEKTRLKIGEAIVQSAEALGPLLNVYQNYFVNVFLKGANDLNPAIRASSLSNLAEICDVIGIGILQHIEDIISGLCNILMTETDEEVKRSAIYLIGRIFKGFGLNVFKMIPEKLKLLYISLKRMLDTNDIRTRAQAELALQQVDEVVSRYLEPLN